MGTGPSPRVDKEMVNIAKTTLERKAGHLDPSKFKDQYEAAPKKFVKRKAAGHTIETKPAERIGATSST